jgi:hypothetical protein
MEVEGEAEWPGAVGSVPHVCDCTI